MADSPELTPKGESTPEVEAGQHQQNIEQLKRRYADRVSADDIAAAYAQELAKFTETTNRNFIPTLTLKDTRAALERRLNNPEAAS